MNSSNHQFVDEIQSFPFYTRTSFLETGFALPDPSITAAALLPLDVKQSVIPLEIQAYREFYGINRINTAHIQGYLDSSNYRIHVQIFTPAQPVRGTVWVLHGYLEHSAVYQPLFVELTSLGFSVIVFDLPGHGLSSGTKSDIEDFATYQSILNDIKQWVDLQENNNHAPLLAEPWLGLGQSTGCAIWMDYLLEQQATDSNTQQLPMISALLMLSPLVRPAKSILLQNPVGRFLLHMVLKRVPRKFRYNNDNQRFQHFIRHEDPLQSRWMGSSWILALLRWDKHIHAKPSCQFKVWIAQGELDETVDWQYNLNFVKQKFNVERLLVMSACSHQLVNERSELRAPLSKMIVAFLDNFSRSVKD